MKVVGDVESVYQRERCGVCVTLVLVSHPSLLFHHYLCISNRKITTHEIQVNLLCALVE